MLLLGGGVYAYYQSKHHNKTTNSTTSTNTTAVKPTTNTQPTVTPPASEITSGPGTDWNTYTNNKVGFSVQIPKQFLSSDGAQCTKVTYVYDNYGNKVSSPAHYIPAQGVVPATVVEDGNNFYVVEEYTYQLTGKTNDGSGHELASGCQKMQTTVDVVNGYKQANSIYELNMLPLSVVTAQNQQDVLNWAKGYFKDTTVTMTLKDNAGGWQDVTLDCSSSNPCTDFNYKFYLRYYKAQNKLVYLQQGQSGHLQTPDGKSFYDQQVFDSFKLK